MIYLSIDCYIFLLWWPVSMVDLVALLLAVVGVFSPLLSLWVQP